MTNRSFSHFLSLLALGLLLLGAALPARAGDILSPGELIQGHAKFEDECVKCHKRFDKAAQSGLCRDCHKEIRKDVEAKTGFHGRFKEDKECRECHTEHKGRNAHIVVFDTEGFDHVQTDFPLKDGHKGEKVKCKSCHAADKKYREAPATCNGCHKKDDKHKGSLGTDCAKCHTEKDWKKTSFDHDKTKYKLLYKHVDVKCLSCHINNVYKDTPAQCSACHKKDDAKAHKGKFGQKCESCHIEKGWKDILFDHNKTKYKLQFKHVDVKCTACHAGDLYKDKLQTNCAACHKKDDDKAHKGRFGPKCESCHTEKGWKEILFDHDKTKFKLLNKHVDVKCSNCHTGDLYKDKLQTTCVSCHKKDDDKAHKGKFGPKCETCHNEKSWKEILFNHDKDTKYPLLGKHRPPAKCTSCHKGDLYKDKLPVNCYACHQNDDKHKGQEGKKCESCHSEESWNKAKFNHRQSRFPLAGKHVEVECKKCHAAATFKDAPSDCGSCHEKQDVHKRRLGTACENCHNARDWKVWDFDHDKTRFKLGKGHEKLSCYECHQKPEGKKISLVIACGGCHAKDDPHDGKFTQQCERCHDSTTWKNVHIGNKTVN